MSDLLVTIYVTVAAENEFEAEGEARDRVSSGSGEYLIEPLVRPK